MQSPESYRQEHYNDSYYDLIALRKEITDRIRDIENENVPMYEMTPETLSDAYKVYHEYLKVICDLILWRVEQG